MKKLLFLFFTFQAHAVIVTQCSFNDSIGNNPNKSILYGSQQWMSLSLSQLDSSRAIPGRLGDTLTIELGDGSVTPNPNTDSIVYKCCISKVFSKIIPNKDGSRTINFKMPNSFPKVKFYVYSGHQGPFHAAGNNGLIYGQFSSVGIEEYSLTNSIIKEINYYDLLGQKMQYISGICIRETIYETGYIRRQKIYKP